MPNGGEAVSKQRERDEFIATEGLETPLGLELEGEKGGDPMR